MQPRSSLRLLLQVVVLATLGLVPYASGAPSVAGALDQPGWEFTALPAGAWRVREEGTTSFATTNMARAILQTALTGPGTLTFRWRLAGRGPDDSASFHLAPQPGWWSNANRGLDEDTGWRVETISVPPGRQMVEWRLDKSSVTPSQAMLWLDALSFEREARLPLDQALAAPFGTWAATGSPTWEGGRLSLMPQVSEAAWLSWPGDNAVGQEPPVLAAEIDGPVRLVFRALQPDPGRRALVVSLDGVAVQEMTSWASWEVSSVDVPAGRHRMEWRLKDTATAATWLLQLLESRPPAADEVARALDTTSIRWSADAEFHVVTEPSGTLDGQDALVSSGSSRASLSGQVDGPAVLSWWARNWTGDVVTVDGFSASVAIRDRTGEWSRAEVEVPPGLHLVSWPEFASTTGAVLDRVEMRPLALASLTAAADEAAIDWPTEPPTGWYGIADPGTSLDRVDSLRIARGAAPLPLTLHGKGTLAFETSGVGGELGEGNAWHVTLGDSDRQSIHVELPGTGPHALTLGAGPFRAVVGQCDRFSWAPEAAPFGGALDSPDETWLATGPAPFTILPDTDRKGRTVLAFPWVAEGASELATWIDGPATVRFSHRQQRGDIQELSATVSAGRSIISQPAWQNSSEPWQTDELNVPVGRWKVAWAVRRDRVRGPVPPPTLLDDVRIIRHQARTEQVVDGPFEVSFERKRPPLPHPVVFTIDGEVRASQSDFTTDDLWQRIVVTERSAGRHVLVWTSDGGADALVRRVSVRPRGAPGTFSAALELVDCDLRLTGPAKITHEPDSPGGDAVRFDTQLAQCHFLARGPCTLRWSARAEQIASVAIAQLPGNTTASYRPAWPRWDVWHSERIDIHDTGTVTLEVGERVYEGQPGSVGLARVRADAAPPPDLGALLGSPGVAWTVSPPDAAQVNPTLNRNYWGAILLGLGLRPEAPLSSSLSATVTGPLVMRVKAANYAVRIDAVPQPSAEWITIPPGSHSIAFLPSQTTSSFFVEGISFYEPASVRAALGLLPGTPVEITSLPTDALPVRGPLGSPAQETFLQLPTGGVVGASVTGTCRLSLEHDPNVAHAIFTYSAMDEFLLGQTQWIDVPAGAHAVQWRFEPGRAHTVRHEPRGERGGDFNAALDTQGVSFRTGAEFPFEEWPDATSVGGSLLRCAALPRNESAWLEFDAAGPCFIEFSWTQRFEPNASILEGGLMVTAGTVVRHVEVPGHALIHVPDAGPLRVRISATRLDAVESSVRELTVDHLVVTPATFPQTPLAEALDAPDLSFSADPSGSWKVIGTGTGGSSALGGAGGNDRSFLTASVPGAGWISYVQSTSSPGDDFFSSSSRTGLVRTFLYPWQTTYSWLARTGFVWLDEVKWQPAPRTTVAEALDTPGREWTTGGDATWLGLAVPELSAKGGNLLVNPALDVGKSAWVETRVNGPFHVQFRWLTRGSSDTALQFSVDGAPSSSPSSRVATLGDASALFQKTVSGAGSHVLRWRCTRVDSARPTALIDAVTIHAGAPGSPSEVAQALDVAGAAISPLGSSSARILLPADGAASGDTCLILQSQNSLLATVKGPGILRYSAKPLDRYGRYPISASAKSTAWPWHESAAVARSSGPDGRGWTVYELPLSEGEHRVSWSVFEQASLLDAVSLQPTAPVSSLTPGQPIEWETGGTNSWVANDIGDVLTSPFSSEDGWLTATLRGPGRFTFAVGESSNSNPVRLEIDGAWMDARQRYGSYDLFLGIGSHRLRWTTASGTVRLHGLSYRVSSADETLPPGIDPRLSFVAFGRTSVELAEVPAESGNARLIRFTAPVDELLNGYVVTPGPGRLDAVNREAWWNDWVDGTSLPPSWTIGEPGSWTTRERSFTDWGAQRLWTEASRLELRSLTFTPELAPSFAEAADCDDVHFTPSRGWHTMLDERHESWDGHDFVTTSSSDSWAYGPDALEASVTGPGVLTYHWQTRGYLSLTIDGVPISLPPKRDWTTQEVILPPGVHSLRWNGSDASLDAFSFSAGETRPAHWPAALRDCIVTKRVGTWLPQPTDGGREGLRNNAATDANEPITILVPGGNVVRYRIRHASRQSLASMQLQEPGFSFATTNESTGQLQERWLLRPGFASLQIALWTTRPDDHAAGDFLELSALEVLPIREVPLAAAIQSPYPVRPSGAGWMALQAGTSGPVVLVASPDTAATLRLSAPGPVRITGRMASTGTVLEVGDGARWSYGGISSVFPEPHPEVAIKASRWVYQQPEWTLVRDFTVAPVSSPGGYAAWLATTGLPPANAAAQADGDGDGASNLLEYLAGTSPTLADLTFPLCAQPSVSTQFGNTYPALAWTTLDRADVAFEVEELASSTDSHTSWQPVEVTITSQPVGEGRRQWKATGHVPVGKSTLWRLKATLLTTE